MQSQGTTLVDIVLTALTMLTLLLMGLALLWRWLRRRWQPDAARLADRQPTSPLHAPLTPEQEQAVRARIAELETQAAQRLLIEPTNGHEIDLPTPPAGVLPTLARLHQDYPDDPYTFAVGWTLRTGQPALIVASLHSDSPHKAGHALLTGETDWGKDGWAFLTSVLLCIRNPPHRLQIFWIDGKGPDGALWRGKAHNWHEPITRADDIARAVPLLEREREQRARLLEQHGVTRWEELPTDIRPPLLWVYVSEVRLLRRALGRELEVWLETELSSARAGGIRYCIGLQNATNLRMEWRSQIGCYIAGGQTSRDGDKPNLNMSTEEIRERGGLPPSALPAAGYFTVRRRREVITVRAPLITLDERTAILSRLPERPGPSLSDVARLEAALHHGNGHAVVPNDPQPMNGVRAHQNATERAADRSENGHTTADHPVAPPSARRSENGHDLPPATVEEIRKLGRALRAAAQGAGKHESIYVGWGLKRGGGPQYKRAEALFELALEDEE